MEFSTPPKSETTPSSENMESSQNLFAQYPFDQVFKDMFPEDTNIEDVFKDEEGWPSLVYFALNAKDKSELDCGTDRTRSLRKHITEELKGNLRSQTFKLREMLDQYPLLDEYFLDHKYHFKSNGNRSGHATAVHNTDSIPSYLQYAHDHEKYLKSLALIGIEEELYRDPGRWRSRSHTAKYWLERANSKA